jgi:hypothetical protein
VNPEDDILIPCAGLHHAGLRLKNVARASCVGPRAVFSSQARLLLVSEDSQAPQVVAFF